MSEPLPCPFCGTVPSDERAATIDRVACHRITCPIDSRSMSLAEWNTRAVTDRERKMVEAMKHASAALRRSLISGVPLDVIENAIREIEPDWSPT